MECSGGGLSTRGGSTRRKCGVSEGGEALSWAIEYQETGSTQRGAEGPESERGLRAQSSRDPDTLALWVLTLEVGETALVLLWGDRGPHVEGGRLLRTASLVPPEGR